MKDELELAELLDELLTNEPDLRAIFGVLWLPMLKRLDILRSRVVLKLNFGLKVIFRQNSNLKCHRMLGTRGLCPVLMVSLLGFLIAGSDSCPDIGMRSGITVL